MLARIFLFLATLIFFPFAAMSQEPVSARSFTATGPAVGTWRWLLKEDGNAYAKWSFSNEALRQGDLLVTFDALVAFGPDGAGASSIQLHYGQPTGDVLGTLVVPLSPSGDASAMGTPMQGQALLSRAELSRIAVDTKAIFFRIEQREHPGVILGVSKLGLHLTPGGQTADDGGGIGALGSEAAEFASNGDMIAGWQWLRDAALNDYAAWTFRNVSVGEGVRLVFTMLATDGVNGGPGIAGRFNLRYGTDAGVLQGRGGEVVALQLTNVSAPNDPVGYMNQGSYLLPSSVFGSADEVTLYLRVERAGSTGPHIAFNAQSIVLAGAEGATTGGRNGETAQGETGDTQEGGSGTTGSDGTTEGTGTSDGTETGTTDEESVEPVVLTVTQSGRHIVSSQAFFLSADEASEANDADGDRVLQAFEDAILERVNPLVELDENEPYLEEKPTDKVVNFGRVALFPSPENARYVIVYFATAWSRDYGRDSIGLDYWDRNFAIRHNGDVERVVEAWEILNDTTLELRWVFTSAHGNETLHSGVWAAQGESCNEGRVKFGPDQEICAALEFSGGRVKLQSSEGKHAYYPTEAACEDVQLVLNLGTGIGEDCGGGGSEIFPVFNAGEPGDHSMDNIDDLFQNEFVWTTDQFCGGDDGTFNPDLPCVGSIGASLDGLPGLMQNVLLQVASDMDVPATGGLFEHSNFGGYRLALSVNSNEPDLRRFAGYLDVNDEASSIKLDAGLVCTFWEDINYGGAKLGPLYGAAGAVGEWPDLGSRGWNDRISSYRCEEAP